MAYPLRRRAAGANSPALSRKLVAGAAALLVLVVAGQAARAQAPAPFTRVPGEVEMLVRFDLQKLEAAPAFAELVETIKASPGYGTGFIGAFGKGDPDMTQFSETFPGSFQVVELGSDLDAPEFPKDGSPFYLIAHGSYDSASATQSLTGSAWTNIAPEGETPVYSKGADSIALSMPSDSTLLMSANPEMLANLQAMEMGGMASAADGPLAGLIAGHGNTPAMVAFHLAPMFREEIAKFAAAPPQESYAVAGLPEAIKEGANLVSGAISLNGNDTAWIDLSLNFADEASATRARAALNKTIPALAALGKMQVADDPRAVATVAEYEKLRFGGAGSIVGLSVPIPPEGLSMLAQQIEQSSSTFGGGDPMAFDGGTMNLDAGGPDGSAGSGTMEFEGGTMNLGDEPLPDGRPSPQSRAIDPEAADPELRRARLAEMGQQFAGGVIPIDQRETFPFTDVADIDGNNWSLNDHAGKVLIVDVWASTEKDCRMTAPYMSALARKYKGDGVEILGISLDLSVDAARTFAASTAMTWPVLCDEQGASSTLATLLGVEGVPTTFVVDRQGRIAAAGLRGLQVEGAMTAVMAEQ